MDALLLVLESPRSPCEIPPCALLIFAARSKIIVAALTGTPPPFKVHSAMVLPRGSGQAVLQIAAFTTGDVRRTGDHRAVARYSDVRRAGARAVPARAHWNSGSSRGRSRSDGALNPRRHIGDAARNAAIALSIQSPSSETTPRLTRE